MAMIKPLIIALYNTFVKTFNRLRLRVDLIELFFPAAVPL